MLPKGIYSLSYAETVETAIDRLQKANIDAVILDASPWKNSRRKQGQRVIRAAAGRPVVVLPTECDGSTATIKAFGADVRYLSWDIVDGDLLEQSIASAIQSYSEKQALSDSEQIFSKVFEASPGLFAISTPKNDRHVNVNKAWLKALGFKRCEVIGNTSKELKLWPNRAIRQQLLKELTVKGFVRGVETQLRAKNGTFLDVLIDGEMIEIKGEPHLLLVAFDISERKRSELALKESETRARAAESSLRTSYDELERRIDERTRQLQEEVEERKQMMRALEASEQRQRDMADAATDWQWETDAEHRFTNFLGRAHQVLGLDITKLLNRTRFDIVEQRTDALENEKWKQHFEDLRNQKPFRDFDYSYKHPKGHILHIRISGKPIYGEDGDFAGYRGTGANVTAQVEAERRAASARRQLTDAIESISDGLILFDSDDRMVMCNSRYREIFRVIEEELVPGIRFKDLARLVAESKFYARASVAPEKWLKERLAYHKNPEKPSEQQLENGRWVKVTEYKTSDNGTLILMSDFTDLRFTEQELRQARDQAEIANQAKSDFLAGMSHELRTPLNAIIGFSDAMRTGLFGKVEHPQYQGYLSNIHDSGIHLLNLINDILDISKIEAGAVELVERRIKIGLLLKRALCLVEERADNRGVHLRTSIPPRMPGLYVDERRIIQVVLNILSNAIKFTPPGGTIKVLTKMQKNGSMLVQIKDSGIGIRKADIDKVMTEFGQVNNTLAKPNEGTGLGLPLSNAIMELHGGTLSISSKIKAGTIVSLSFPAARVRK